MRADIAALGGALVVAGIGVTLTGAGSEIPVPVPIVAGLGLVVALVGLAVTVTESPPSDEVSTTIDANRLGSAFETTLADVETMSSAELRHREKPDELRETVRGATVALVADREGIDRERAARRVSAGSWTDDPVAAAFLSESARIPSRIRLREWLSTTPAVVSRARRTLNVLEGRL